MNDQQNTNQEEYVNLYQASPDELEPLIRQEEDYFHGNVLLSWEGPSDLPDEENRRWFLLIMSASVFVILIAVLMNQLTLALIIAGVAWLSYLLRRLPSQEITYVITTTGFFTQEKFYPWSELGGFWIIKDHGHYVLGLETNKRFFSSLMVLLGTQNPFEVKEALSNFIPEHEDKSRSNINTWIEKAGHVIDSIVDKASQKVKQIRNPKPTNTKETSEKRN